MPYRLHHDNIHRLVNPNLGGEGEYFYPLPVLLGNSKCCNIWHFETFSTSSSKIFMPNSVSLPGSNLQILEKSQTGKISISGVMVKSLVNKNYDNSRNSYDIDMKLGPLIKLDKRNKTTARKIENDIMSAI